MPKMKTKKSLVKKVSVSKNGKITRRATGQNHFNAKETGKKTRSKRNDKGLFKTDAKNIAKALVN